MLSLSHISCVTTCYANSVVDYKCSMPGHILTIIHLQLLMFLVMPPQKHQASYYVDIIEQLEESIIGNLNTMYSWTKVP